MSGSLATGGYELPHPFNRSAAREAFSGELVRLDSLLHREILRLRARYELSLDEFRGLYVSDRQVDELVGRADSADGENDLAAALRALGDLPHALGEPSGIATPWEHLRSNLALTRLECDLLLICLAPELDAKYETLFAYLNNDVTRKWPTTEFAARLLATHLEDKAEVRALTQSDSRLMRLGFLEWVPSSRDLPRAQRGLRMAPALADWLLGLPWCDDALQGLTRLLNVHEAPAAYGVATAELDKAAARAATGEALNLVCCAGSLEDALADAHRVFAAAGREALAVDLAALSSAAPELCMALERVAAVLNVGLVLTPIDALCDSDGRPNDAALASARRLARRGLQIAWVGTRESRWRDLFVGIEGAPFRLLNAPDLAAPERAEVWRALLGERGNDIDVLALADRFLLGAASITRVVRHAEQQAAFDDPAELSGQRLIEAARVISSENLGGITRSVSTRFEWPQLVLPVPVKRRLRDVVSAVEKRPLVFDRWGFADKMGGARGIKVMFAGPSGTGKTMAAAIIARTLSLDLHRVELAAVVSKYIGETEKNLDRAFDTARRSNSILFIDEADALLGKRSEVKDAHDRYANVETAYLLQKMEDHDGVVVLATNLPGNMDEAFSRRMHFVIDFPMPDVSSRERLWRGMMPARAPVAGDVDFGFLARQFVFAGGDIRNMALDAACLAAQEGGEIGMRHFLAAVARQYAKRGKLPTVADFREYFGMLGDGLRQTAEHVS